ncbi:MAG: hypothetical protein EBZ48_01025 [Proteobacteria bacterium]|nr:hypothetical protein [Pseudomonadota bacterium]
MMSVGMRGRLIRLVSILLPLCCLSGCAPGLGHKLPVSRFPAPEEVVSRPSGKGRVLVRSFSDGRADHAVAIIDGRSVEPGSDVSAAVRAAMESYLKAAGFGVGGSDSPVLVGTVQRWSVVVKPDFPTSTAEAVAGIGVELYSSSQEVLFRGTYRGEYSAEHPLMNQDRIAEALGQAMAAAMQQAINDSRFTAAIESANGGSR